MTERLRQLRAYWDAKRDGRPMPCRRDIDPVEIPRLLPHLLLVDVVGGGADFRFRIVGSRVRDRSRENHAGLLFSQVYPDPARSQIWRDYGRVAREGRPVEAPIPYVGPDRYTRHAHHLLLPVADEAGALAAILTIIDYDEAPLPDEAPAVPGDGRRLGAA